MNCPNRPVRRRHLTPRFVHGWGVAMLLTAITARGDEGWPQWRGREGQGHATTARDLPVRWSETENVAWKTPLPGRGWSSPVLDAKHVWLTTAIESEANADEAKKRLGDTKNSQPLTVSGPVRMHALCVDRETGRLIHDIELFTVRDPQPIHSLNSYASPSPVLDAGRLHCHFGDCGTACVDTATARVLWTNRDLRLNHENGPGSTPIVWRDLLIVHCDGSDVQYIAALEAATGAIVWKTNRSGTLSENPDLKKAYGTPIVVGLDGHDVLLSPAADWLYAYDPRTGRELWKLNYGVLGFSIVPRPVVAHGLVYVSTSFMQPEMLAVRLAGDGAPQIAWRQKKGAPTMSSPLVIGDELSVVSDKGIMTCLDARSGDVLWSERLGGNFSSSPLFADGRIYVGNRDGHTFVIKPGKEFDLLATNQLDGRIFATPAAVGSALYLRTDKALYRIENR
ncbi:MAG: PQQ-binding-like beta-propeller repeat protein [Planctomycetia bacterium]